MTETISLRPIRAEYQRNWRAANREQCNKWNRNYLKLYRQGLRRGSKKVPVSERFEDKWIPEPNSGCWLWIACANSRGYGVILVEGRPNVAHRVSYLIHRGEIPDGLLVLHKCDTPLCVNPNHLFLGTNRDNAIDMAKKGRQWMQKRKRNETKCTAK